MFIPKQKTYLRNELSNQLQKKYSSKKKQSKIYLYDDNRIAISMHPYCPTPQKEKREDSHKEKNDICLMTIKNYIRQMKNAHKTLWQRTYNESSYFFVVLTSNRTMETKDLQYQFRKFLQALEYHYGNVEYVRAFEYHKNGVRLHIHAILQFAPTNGNTNLILDNQHIAHLWSKVGTCHIEPVYDIYGAIQYITKFKENNILKITVYNWEKKMKPYDVMSKVYTNFCQNTKIISVSRNFGIPAEQSHRKEFSVTRNQAIELINLYKKHKERFVRIDGHYYDYKRRSPTAPYCIDNVYLQAVADISREEILKILESS